MSDPDGYFAGTDDGPPTDCQPGGGPQPPAEPSPLPVQLPDEFAHQADDVTVEPAPGKS